MSRSKRWFESATKFYIKKRQVFRYFKLHRSLGAIVSKKSFPLDETHLEVGFQSKRFEQSASRKRVQLSVVVAIAKINASFCNVKRISNALSLVVSDLRKRFPLRVRILPTCRGELPAALAWLMSKHLWSGWNW